MIKYIGLFFITSLYLYGAGFWTLSGVNKANIYVLNEIAYVNQITIRSAKEKMLEMLKSANIKTGLPDSPTLMLELQELQNDDEHYVYVKLLLGEEVKTFRDDKSVTYALTYSVTDFVETDDEELDNAILESVDFLLSQFKEQLEDDKE